MSLSYQTARVAQIKPSPSITISVRARALAAEGRQIVDMSLGEPDFDTPAHIVEAAYRAMREGNTRYTAPDGTGELKAAIVHKFKSENGLDFTTQQISVGNGAKQVIYNALAATLEEGDEVIVPAPYWVSYTDMVILLGGKPVVLPCTFDEGFKLTPERLAAALTPKTRWLLINSPSNPSGATYSRAELEALGEVLEKHPDVLIMSDEIYEHILYTDEKYCSFLQACPQLHERVLIVNGVSKAYAMTGWRIGYAAGPAVIIAAMKKIQSQSTSNPCSIAQYAALAALEGDQSFIQEMVTEFKGRHERLVKGLNSIPGIKAIPADGTFYSFPNVEELMAAKGVATDVELCELLLEEQKVALVPGTAFGAPGHFRLSFAAAQEVLDDAVKRIAAFAAN